jgi:hypothetical protein
VELSHHLAPARRSIFAKSDVNDFTPGVAKAIHRSQPNKEKPNSD